HLLPLGLLALALLGVGVHDLAFVQKRQTIETETGVEGPAPAPVDPKPYLALSFHDADDAEAFVRSKRNNPGRRTILDDEPWLAQPTMRFGLVMVRDPRTRQPVKGDTIKLTFREDGSTNNTCLRLDGTDVLFGTTSPRGKPARWVEMQTPLGKDASGRERSGSRSVWRYD